MKTRRRTRGFTLVELMVVVTIIGILASIAIPSFQTVQLRSKSAERSVMRTAIQRAIGDLWVRDGKFPLDAPPWSWLYLIYDNPNATPTTSKRPWRTRPLNTFDHWNLLSLQVEGGVYYSYYGYAYSTGTQRVYILQIYGDLDGDGVLSRHNAQWNYVADVLQPSWVGLNTECPSCTWFSDVNPRAW